jgi:oligosaccharide repeat unit polymerase
LRNINRSTRERRRYDDVIEPRMSWPVLDALDVFAIALFAISYYRNCYRRGYRIDFWHAELFLLCVFPNMLMLPFARSELNVIVVGTDLDAVVAAVPAVFLIALLGYFAVLIGGTLWQLNAGLGLRSATAQLLDIVPRCSMMLMSSRVVLVFQACLCLLLQFIILTLYFSANGFAFDLRAYTFANPTLRPVALIISNYSIVIASHCLARYVDLKERILLLCTLALTFGLVFFGARGNLVAIYISVLLCYFIWLRDGISLWRMSGVIVVVTIFGFYLGNVRSGDYSLAGFFGTFLDAVFYGNTFSDLRDFAWVYSAWNHVLWEGKTYLAAVLSFVPRFASHFRDTWGLGAKTAATAGFDPDVHPGLRPGIFGESFFNFGLPGVLAIGFMLGIVLRRVDSEVKRALASSPASMMKAFASTMLITVATTLAVSAGFSGLYILAAIYFFTWLCILVQRFFRPRRVLNEFAE